MVRRLDLWTISRSHIYAQCPSMRHGFLEFGTCIIFWSCILYGILKLASLFTRRRGGREGGFREDVVGYGNRWREGEKSFSKKWQQRKRSQKHEKKIKGIRMNTFLFSIYNISLAIVNTWIFPAPPAKKADKMDKIYL